MLCYCISQRQTDMLKKRGFLIVTSQYFDNLNRFDISHKSILIQMISYLFLAVIKMILRIDFKS